MLSHTARSAVGYGTCDGCGAQKRGVLVALSSFSPINYVSPAVNRFAALGRPVLCIRTRAVPGVMLASNIDPPLSGRFCLCRQHGNSRRAKQYLQEDRGEAMVDKTSVYADTLALQRVMVTIYVFLSLSMVMLVSEVGARRVLFVAASV